jgi:hypothetical protein
MEFPRLVFTSPGPFTCNGGTYGHVPVKDSSEYEAAMKAGYHPTVPEALEAGKKPKAVEPEKQPEPQKPAEPPRHAPVKGMKPVVPEPRAMSKK